MNDHKTMTERLEDASLSDRILLHLYTQDSIAVTGLDVDGIAAAFPMETLEGIEAAVAEILAAGYIGRNAEEAS